MKITEELETTTKFMSQTGGKKDLIRVTCVLCLTVKRLVMQNFIKSGSKG